MAGGYLYAWWRGDERPELGPADGLAIGRADDPRLVAAVARLTPAEARARLARGHRAYLARLHGTPVAYGWVATREGDIGELGLSFGLPGGERYLWDFATRPRWRGRGLYPRLLQAIIAHEIDEADRFWIGHERENTASERGILKAGFGRVAGLGAGDDGRPVLTPIGPADRARAAAHLLGVPLARA
jgi:GNAT superfamily N-acetyltransferase